ncbi:MAG: DUF192 domain-containing protein [Candidatus Omnitrophica bacterium]|nr:DUF192 domain-containing protein [Candidatus Omnitrophota bacterium]
MTKRFVLYNTSNNQEVAEVESASTFSRRLFGLLFEKSKESAPALWLVPCKAVHTCGMRWPIDLIFLSKTFQVVEICKGVKPFSWPVVCWRAHSVVEISRDHWDKDAVRVGDQLVFR